MLLGFWFYTFCACVFAILWMIQPRKRPKNYPPGPRSFGLFGSYPSFLFEGDLNFFELLTKPFASRYEKVMSFDLGPLSLISINDVDILKESFGKQALYGRPPFTALQPFKETRGFAMRSDAHSKEIQKFTINELRNFGVGKQSLGPLIEEEAEELVKALRNRVNEPLSTEHFFNISAFNALWMVLSGERLSLDNYKNHRYLTLLKSVSQNTLKMGFILAFPQLWTWIPYFFEDAKQGQVIGKEMFMDLIEARVSNSKDTGISFESRGDFTSAFLNKIQQTSDPSSAFYGKAAYENAAITLQELVIGGLETSGTALSWLCLYLALNPEKQEKLQKQIDEVLLGEIPTLEHKNRLPYVEAVMNETLRRSPVLPVGVHRLTTEDTTIGGYDVPKDTVVLANVYGIHHNPKLWGDPQVFRPERFLTPDESSILKQDGFFPFGTGKKRCPGEQLSRDTMFLLITRVFREFSVKLNPNEPLPKTSEEEVEVKTVLAPPQHTLIFSIRNN